MIIDAGICHGSVGLAMIYRRMYIETDIEIFGEAVKYWIQVSLSFSKFDDGLAGYKSFYIDKWVNDYCLLSGIAGIGLMFISFLMDDNQKWDEIFLL